MVSSDRRPGDRRTRMPSGNLTEVERRILEQGVRNLTGYISELPDASQWKLTFRRVRGEIVALLDAERSAQRAQRLAAR